MTRDDLIRMARDIWGPDAILPFNGLFAFADLVASSEREDCAQTCEFQADESGGQDWYVSGCIDSAAAIRARGNK